MNEKTQVDLENLWEVGASLLPSVANIHADAAVKVHAARSHDAGLFETPGMPEGSKSVVFDVFCELRDQLQTVARTTSMNLRDSGAGCVKAADSYSRTDLTNAERLEYAETKNEIGKVTPPEDPPAPPAR